MRTGFLLLVAVLTGLAACVPTPLATPVQTVTKPPSTLLPESTLAPNTVTPAARSHTPSGSPPVVPTLSPQALELLQPDRVVKHPPTANNPYSWFSYFPSGAEKHSPITVSSWPHSGGGAVENYVDREAQAEKEINRYIGYAREFQVPLVLVAIPRVARLYVSSLHLGTFTTNEEMFQRPDLKFIDAVWNQYIPMLRKANLAVDDRVAMMGFSNTGTFAYRFAILHPEKVEAMWLGAFTPAPLPTGEYNGRAIDYPLGVRNLESLTGKPFEIPSFKTIPQFIVVGENDTLFQNDILCCNDIFSTEDEKNFIRQNLGDTNPKRLKKFQEILISMGVNSQFKSYPGVGHETPPTMMREGFNFLLATIR